MRADVAGGATQAPVLSFYGEGRLVVIESLAMGEVLRGMADRTFLSVELLVELALVFVFMTVDTEIGVFRFEFENLFFADQVAGLAGNLLVPAGQGKGRLIVVETVFLVFSDHVLPAAGGVAFRTFFS